MSDQITAALFVLCAVESLLTLIALAFGSYPRKRPEIPRALEVLRLVFYVALAVLCWWAVFGSKGGMS